MVAKGCGVSVPSIISTNTTCFKKLEERTLGVCIIKEWEMSADIRSAWPNLHIKPRMYVLKYHMIAHIHTLCFYVPVKNKFKLKFSKQLTI